jgi:hypothetical protein
MAIIISAAGGNFLSFLFNIVRILVLQCKRKRCNLKQAKKEPSNKEIASPAIPEEKP